MAIRWLTRFAITAALTAVFAGLITIWGTSAAWAATTTIPINLSEPTTAADFDTHECDPNQGGGPYPDQDVWVFNLPAQGNASPVFQLVTATFDTGSGTTTKTIPSDGGAIVFIGTSKAYIALPAGWTLIDAIATIDVAPEAINNVRFFVLTHTCPAGTSTTPPTSTPTPTPTDTPTGTPTPGDTPSGTPSATPTPSGPPTSPGQTPTTPGAVPPPSGGGLPDTGARLGGIVVAGLALIVTGAALLLLWRRRNAGSPPTPTAA